MIRTTSCLNNWGAPRYKTKDPAICYVGLAGLRKDLLLPQNENPARLSKPGYCLLPC